MEINNAITVWSEVIPEDHLIKLQKYCDFKDIFTNATVIGENKIDNNNIKQRQTQTCPLIKISESFTNVRWRGYFEGLFIDKINEYSKSFKYGCEIARVCDLEILKYEEKGRYVFHTDDCVSIPRTLSMIFLINDNYEGGELVFSDPRNNDEFFIPKKKNTLIIWPSSFLYPHAVKPVSKGTRFSLVGWAR